MLIVPPWALIGASISIPMNCAGPSLPWAVNVIEPEPLAEITSPDFPGERLVACYNAARAKKRREKRQRLLRATEVDLSKLAAEVQRRTKEPLTTVEIALKAGKVIGRHKRKKHYGLGIAGGSFAWSRNEAGIEREEQLDGI